MNVHPSHRVAPKMATILLLHLRRCCLMIDEVMLMYTRMVLVRIFEPARDIDSYIMYHSRVEPFELKVRLL